MTKHTHSELIDLWPKPSPVSLATDIQQKPGTVRKWRLRGRIPPDYWPDIVASAEKHGLPVSYKTLAESERPHQ